MSFLLIETKSKMSKSRLGKSHTEQAKQNMRKPKSKDICPYCKKLTSKNNRHHFNNCKYKES